MMMIQFLIKTIINVMGKIYVFLDKRVKHDTSPILGLVIDYDLRDKSRKELCNHIEDKFKYLRVIGELEYRSPIMTPRIGISWLVSQIN